MKREILMALALTLIGAACDDGSAARPTTDTNEASGLGSIKISLVGMDSKGTQYRLRGADFLIAKEGQAGSDSGTTPLETLSTELDPSAAYLSTRLGPGMYQVTLQGAWYIERLDPAGAQRVERATLLGEATQRTNVAGGAAPAMVFYRFGIDGDVVDFDTGELRIGVDFQLPRDAGVDGGGTAGTDGGLDAGMPEVDAGQEADAGPASDAGEELDAGGEPDAGPELDAASTAI